MDEQQFKVEKAKARKLRQSQWWKEKVQAGKAYTLLPPCEVQAEIEDGRLACIPIEPPGIQRTLCVAHCRDKQLLPEVDMIAKLIHREAPDYFI